MSPEGPLGPRPPYKFGPKGRNFHRYRPLALVCIRLNLKLEPKSGKGWQMPFWIRLVMRSCGLWTERRVCRVSDGSWYAHWVREKSEERFMALAVCRVLVFSEGIICFAILTLSLLFLQSHLAIHPVPTAYPSSPTCLSLKKQSWVTLRLIFYSPTPHQWPIHHFMNKICTCQSKMSRY